MLGPPISTADYLNPVYPHSFPDPFVLKFRGEYFAYCTGFAGDGQVFGVLGSRDLVNWSPIGSAMEPLQNGAPFYWAPEVTYWNGKFYLYYSAGNEALMELRVAVSDRPDRGFIDSGQTLTTEDFAIDAHVFIDDDGTKYLFYATDFLEHSYVGTGTVVDTMIDWFTLSGQPRPVTRAKYDWQVYDPQRKEKGGVRWHTVEGPAVFKRKGVYFQMFSGGNWQNTTYGVSFAVSDAIGVTDEWRQYSDGESVVPILRTIPDAVVGPGHNSIIRGPNNRELYCVYHRWTEAGRVLAIDRMDCVGRRIFVLGATITPQPQPFHPQAAGFSDRWRSEGVWQFNNGNAVSSIHGIAKLNCVIPQSFVCEFTIRVGMMDAGNVARAYFGLDKDVLFVAVGNCTDIPNGAVTQIALASGVDHLIRIEVDGHWAKLVINNWEIAFDGWIDGVAQTMSMVSNDVEARFSGYAMTEGFEDLFDRENDEIRKRGWTIKGSGGYSMGVGELLISSVAGESVVARDQVFGGVDYAANIRADLVGGDSGFGLVIFDDANREILRLYVGKAVRLSVGEMVQTFSLPVGWTTSEYHQYRLLINNGRAAVYLEDNALGGLPCAATALKPAVFCTTASIAIEMIRATHV